MKTLFQAENRQGFLINIDLDQSFLKEVLWNWLKENHSDIYWDIEMNEGGSIKLEIDTNTSPKCITFSGDNGVFELVECEVENI
jgi:hypothetical protein|tara:strand:- start:411 stop:662 length:252 start_codon:yes stop_codon:yes gene_type:complete